MCTDEIESKEKLNSLIICGLCPMLFFRLNIIIIKKRKQNMNNTKEREFVAISLCLQPNRERERYTEEKKTKNEENSINRI